MSSFMLWNGYQFRIQGVCFSVQKWLWMRSSHVGMKNTRWKMPSKKSGLKQFGTCYIDVVPTPIPTFDRTSFIAITGSESTKPVSALSHKLKTLILTCSCECFITCVCIKWVRYCQKSAVGQDIIHKTIPKSIKPLRMLLSHSGSCFLDFYRES